MSNDTPRTALRAVLLCLLAPQFMLGMTASFERPGRVRGRVFSRFGLTWQPMRLASLLLGGLLAGAAGIRAVSCLGGALQAALTGLALASPPDARRGDHAVPSPGAGHSGQVR